MNESQTRATTLQGIVYASIIGGSLFVLVKLFDIRFTTPYQVLTVLAVAFGFITFRRYDLAVPWNPGRRGSVGTRLLWSWATFVGALLFLSLIHISEPTRPY